MFCCAGYDHENSEVIDANGQKPRVFEVEIERRRDKKLGLDLEVVHERKVLPVRSLIAGQLAEDYNSSHKDFAIRPGDRIVSVNGVNGRADEMMRCLRDFSQTSIKLKLVRMSPETDDREVLHVGESYHCHRDASSSTPMLGAIATTLATASGGMAHLVGMGRNRAAEMVPVEPAPSDEDSSRGEMSRLRRRSEEDDGARRAVLLDEARRDLPAPWLAIWSRSLNKYYYFNPRSQESSWRRPPPIKGQPASDEDNGSIVGSWAYSDGAYTIARVDNELRYKEDAHGVHGIVEEHDGWLVVDLMLMRDDSSQLSGSMKEGESIGRLRFLRRGNTVVSNFQRTGHGDMWEEDVVATKTRRAERREEADSLVGSWSYHNGTYSVSYKEDRLLYEETCYGIYGWLEEVPGGWMQAELRALSTTDGHPATTVGWIRLKRRGPCIVSNYRGPDDQEWEPDSLATKDVGSIEGEWGYPDGSYTICHKNGFLLYEEPSCGIYGVLQQEPSGWMEADLLIAMDSRGRKSDEERHVGKIRLQRRGSSVVSNFRGSDTEPWERDIVATRVED